MMNHSARRIDPAGLAVNADSRPGWISGSDRIPAAGEEVFCAAGTATIVKVLGKTGDGSRLLELKLADEGAKPFFAAASNVLVAPEAAALV